MNKKEEFTKTYMLVFNAILEGKTLSRKDVENLAGCKYASFIAACKRYKFVIPFPLADDKGLNPYILSATLYQWYVTSGEITIDDLAKVYCIVNGNSKIIVENALSHVGYLIEIGWCKDMFPLSDEIYKQCAIARKNTIKKVNKYKRNKPAKIVQSPKNNGHRNSYIKDYYPQGLIVSNTRKEGNRIVYELR